MRTPVKAVILSGGKKIIYLMRDEYITDRAGGAVNATAAEPGPGTRSVIDAGNRMSIAAGRLVVAAGGAEGNPGIVYGALSRVAGRAVIARSANVGGTFGAYFGYTTDALSLIMAAVPHGIYFRQAALRVLINGGHTGVGDLDAFAAGTDYRVAIVLRAVGAFHLAELSAGVWSLIWVDGTLNAATVYPVYSQFAGECSTTYLRVTDLTSWGAIATNETAIAAIGATTTSEANAIIEATWTAVAGETYELSVRRTDDDNRWIIRGDQVGSTIKLIQREAGAETERASAAQTWTNGTAYRIVVTQNGNTIKTYVANTAKNSYALAAFNNGATGAKTSHAVANLIAWPRTIPAGPAGELSRAAL